MQATAQAQPNIALVKYWGKRDVRLNLPVAGSISITLDTLWTRTSVRFDETLSEDRFLLNGEPAPDMLLRVSPHLDLYRQLAGKDFAATVISQNNFPTAAGLASSASGFAALAVAAASATGLELSPTELSALARQGSGSAARSIFGGFVEMMPGERRDGSDAAARELLPASEWPLEIVVAVTSDTSKAVGSTRGMEHTSATSPYYRAWVSTLDQDLQVARMAVRERDFEALAEISEHSCLKMHGLAMSAQPGLLYWNPATVGCITTIRELRSSGVPVFFTIDAGPQVKAVCGPGASDSVASALSGVPGVARVIRSGLGAGARLIPDTLEESPCSTQASECADTPEG